jgi:UDP-N-acetylmuramoyl-tripeptide--D-alanyl-D-alanine ligase
MVTGWSIDSRTVQPGDLFFALRGPNHDGNAYITAALKAGAVAAVADRAVEPPPSAPVFLVPDTLHALQQLAAWARGRWNGDVIGITGSAGKTSTKDAIADILATHFPIGRTAGNFNNHVGVPLSILRLPDDARAAVIEIGMNHAGEIRDLAAIARPRIGVVTNVGHAHMENFESLEGVAAAKRELVEGLPGDGIAVLNADDALVAKFGEGFAGRVITFGIGGTWGPLPLVAAQNRRFDRGSEGTATYGAATKGSGFARSADVLAEDIEMLADGSRFRVGETRFETNLAGRHSILNILAGIAVAGIYGISPGELVAAVANLKPGTMRGERLQAGGILVWNDCYNSNPDAVRSMIDLLRDTPARRRIAVLGEMLELGRWSECLHREVGRYVARSGIPVLLGIRGDARGMVDAAVEAGLDRGSAYFFEDPGAAGDRLREIAREGDAILFKGSRGTHVEEALERFRAAS